MSVSVHEAFCLDSPQDRYWFIDHFLGDQLQDEWRDAGTGSAAVVDQQTGGIVRLTTGALVNDNHYIDWNTIRTLHVDKKVSMEVRMRANDFTRNIIQLNLQFDNNNRIFFRVQTGAGFANWDIRTIDGGAVTTLDSGVPHDDNDYHIYRIECHTHDGNHVHFYIDGTECNNSPINTNVPDDAGDYLEPHLDFYSRVAEIRTFDIDYVAIRQDR